MHLMTLEKCSKSYGLKPLLNQVDFSVDSSDKIGFVGVNGVGKSTLLKIIAGLEPFDSGTRTTMKNIRINYLEQEQRYHEDITVLEQIFKGQSDAMKTIRAYEEAAAALEMSPDDADFQAVFNQLSERMVQLQLFELDYQIKSILVSLGIHDFMAKVTTLSGGQKKRLALAEVLVTPCDLLVLDEPTNHLDIKSILWLENTLRSRNGALIMITHDRYFLDRIVTKTVELHQGKLFEYQGNYGYYVAKKSERMELEANVMKKRLNLYKRELEWMRAGVQARGTKAKSRIQRFHQLANQLETDNQLSLSIDVAYTRLGGKIIEIKDLSMGFDGQKLFDNFEYAFTSNDRIGIVGDNGTGKTTLMNLINGSLTPLSGDIAIGSTVKIGYFSQTFDGFKDIDQRAIDYIKEIAEYVTTPDGHRISASELMETFLFTSEMQWTPIGKLSGGEQRRLQLLAVLIDAPNVLLLDEPTNNLDLDTLNVFEAYLDQFRGVILCVSHDRYFLDRICDKLFVLESEQISILSQSYEDYLAQLSDQPEPTKETKSADKPTVVPERTEKAKKIKLSFNEVRALEQLPLQIEKLSDEIEQLDVKIEAHATDFVKLTELTQQKEKLEDELLDKMEQLEQLMEKERLISAPF